MKRLLIPLLPLLLMACAKPSEQPATPTASPAPTAVASVAIDTSMLVAYHWQLSDAKNAQGARIDALFVRADKPVTLNFQSNRIAISNSCNGMNAGFRIEGDKLNIDKMASTMMACVDPALSALDTAISQRLAGVLSANLQRAPETLTLTNSSGDTLAFKGVPTAETRFGGPGETMFLEIAAQTQPCSHPLIPNMQCMQMREIHFDENGLRTGEPGQWQNLFEGIEGYTHEDGVRNVLRVKRFTRNPVPADASSIVYVLDMVVESETVKP
jgi:heat shock protein HslJ